MSTKSNDQGRAYEFAYLTTLQEEISKYRNSEIDKNSGYRSAKKAWNTLSDQEKVIYKTSALAGVREILSLEPTLFDSEKGKLRLKIQTDDEGVAGDVRDVLICDDNTGWEIGLSIKHNHFAVKHSRLSKTLDFGEKWYGLKCSDEYWSEVKPTFDYLEGEKKNGEKWRNLPNKENDVYLPLLTAFKNEIIRQNSAHSDKIPRMMVEYLLGRFDFYKAIGVDSKRLTQIQAYNLKGTLNQDTNNCKNDVKIPVVPLPTRILRTEFRQDSKNTLDLRFDQGWGFSFRIHNASTRVEPSLKFDVQMTDMPDTIFSKTCEWE